MMILGVVPSFRKELVIRGLFVVADIWNYDNIWLIRFFQSLSNMT